MTKCSYCEKIYESRPQVKRPKACSDSQCQKKRQSNNERAWHALNEERFDKRYHSRQKTKRIATIKHYVSLLADWISIGSRFRNQSISIDSLILLFFKFLAKIGLRKINKLWIVD